MRVIQLPAASSAIWQASVVAVLLVYVTAVAAEPQAAGPPRPQVAASKEPPLRHSLELSRPVRPWEFWGSFGTRAGIFGSESGRLEAWVYPLKIFRNLRLEFDLGDRTMQGEALARTIVVRPEASAIVYAGESFVVRQTVLAPPHEPGALILLDIETADPLGIRVIFQRDFQLMWPASLGGTYLGWDESLRAFALGEEQKRFFALVGSPAAEEAQLEYFTNYGSAPESSFELKVPSKGKHRLIVALAASFESRAGAEKTYLRLTSDAQALEQDAASYYARYLAETVSLKLPDKELEQAYDWARVTLLQGVVDNPFLGTGLIAGYRASGEDARPGFAWFFGRDALWTVWALTATGDYSHARTALDFLAKYQRDDGKIMHELSQSATFVPWFEAFPYGYASADATPLFILAMNEYAVRSGDVSFVKKKWPNVWKAYEFLRSTRDEHGFARNQGVGHGWVEGGPLLPVKTELYQSGLGVAALAALANLARLTGKEDVSRELASEFERQRKLLNDVFWIPEKEVYAFALDEAGRKVDVVSVLATVPMWFDVLDDQKAGLMIRQLSAPDHATDWGMRILSSQRKEFDPAGYHFGSVWPLFTGWASVGEYRYHRTFPAYANLRANALLALDGSLGHVTEVLSGSHYEPLSTTSPHQIWSAAMVVTPLLRGLLGLEVDAPARQVVLAPHVPARWDWFEIDDLQVDKATLNIKYRRAPEEMILEVDRQGGDSLELEFSPAISLRAEVQAAEINNRPVPFRLRPSAVDQHIVIRFPVPGGRSTLRIRLRNDFAIHVKATLPALGGTSRNLRVVSESWNAKRDELALEILGVAGRQYRVFVRSGISIKAVDGANFEESAHDFSVLVISFPPAETESFVRKTVVIRFGPGPGN